MSIKKSALIVSLAVLSGCSKSPTETTYVVPQPALVAPVVVQPSMVVPVVARPIYFCPRPVFHHFGHGPHHFPHHHHHFRGGW